MEKPRIVTADWETLLARSIVPKLQWAMQELVINPQHQVLDQFHWLMAWNAAMPPQHINTMLESFFFPKLQQVLYQWLVSNPNYEEVTQWYLGWKSLFPEELLAQEGVRRGFNYALDMMNQALGGHVPPPQAPPPVPNLPAPSVTPRPGAAPLRPAEMSFKELVEAFAAQHDVAFVPKAGRTHEGLQVWGLGTVSVVLDLFKQMVHAQMGDRWMPVSLEMVLAEHSQRAANRGG